MGVHGLWKLIDASGKPIPVETLENRILAVDVSIWLYQLVKGFQENAGRSLANAYLLGLFHRICKLLFYRIKPIFVFDGGVPVLKRKTILARQSNRNKAGMLGEKLRQTLLENLAKQEALGKAIGESVVLPKMFQPKQDTLFELPPLPTIEEALSIEESSDSDNEYGRYQTKDLDSIDVTSDDFLSLPADMRHDILTELKETRKQNSWAKFHLMPQKGDDFSGYQMSRLLKRRAVQVQIEKTESEMGTRGFTLSDLQTILSDQGVQVAQRIAADNRTRLLYSNKLKEVLAEGANSKPKKIPKLKHSKRNKNVKFGQYISSSETGESTNESDVDDELLTQDELLKIIKQENSSEGSSQLICTRDEMEAGTSGLKTFNAKTGIGGTKLEVNDHLVENESRNNEVELCHGTFPQKYLHCQTSSPSATLQTVTPVPPQAKNVHPVQILKEKSETKVSTNIKDFVETLIDVKKSKSAHFSSLDTVLEKLEKPSKETELTDSDKIIEKINKTNIYNDSSSENILTRLVSVPEPLDDKNNYFIQPDSPKDYKVTKSNLPILVNPPQLLVNKIVTNSNSRPLIGQKQNGVNEEDQGRVSLKDDTEESDDDFIEVNNENDSAGSESLSYVNISKDNKKPLDQTEKPLEIVVNSVNNLEDDIFADVFELIPNENSPKSKTGVCKEIIEKEEIKKSSESKVKTNKNIEPSFEDPEFSMEESMDYDFPVINEEEFSSSEIDDTHLENKKISSPVPQLSFDEIVKMKKELEQASDRLIQETRKEERIAVSVTEQITMDAQELLQLFGLPYVIAPMEAEAQCAFLDLNGQTQGTITDDSDIWLFGANNVYKNFFDQKKFVQQFKSSDIDRCYHMGRDEMIMLALLSGSDYTTGLTGVGAVTALEIIAHFPKTNDEISPVERLKQFANDFKKSQLKGRIANKLKKCSLTEGFPSAEVVKAYIEPQVDTSNEPFSWSKPNIRLLRKYALEKFGWDQLRTDKLLQPILDNLNKTQMQSTMHRFFEWKFDGVEKQMSKRVEKAVTYLKTPSLVAEEEEPNKQKKSSNKSENLGSSTSKDNKKKRYTKKQKTDSVLTPVMKDHTISLFPEVSNNPAQVPSTSSIPKVNRRRKSSEPSSPKVAIKKDSAVKERLQNVKASTSDIDTLQLSEPQSTTSLIPDSIGTTETSNNPIDSSFVTTGRIMPQDSKPNTLTAPPIRTTDVQQDTVIPLAGRWRNPKVQSLAFTPDMDKTLPQYSGCTSEILPPHLRPKITGKILSENDLKFAIRSKTPAQIAREKAAKKLKEAKIQGKNVRNRKK